MRKTWAALAAVCLGLPLASVPAGAQSPGPAASLPAMLATPVLVRYEDPAGDIDGGIGPDIVAVTLSQADPDSVSIAVEFATAPPLGHDLEAGWTDMLLIVGATGPEGVVPLPTEGVDADFATGLHGANLQESVAQGAPLNIGDRMDEHAVEVTVDGATATLTLTRESLGDPDRIVFLMWTVREGVSDGETGGGDAFPDNAPEGPYTQVAWTFPAR
jgi:hypothetical protein